MRVFFDHQAFTIQKFGGISRYFVELSRELSLLDEVTVNTPVLVTNNQYYRASKQGRVLGFFGSASFRGQWKMMTTVNNLYSAPMWMSGSFDVFHPTYYNPYFLRWIGQKPFVVTVYDMIHEKFAPEFSTKDKATEHKKLLVERAAKVIAISQSTKNDLVDIFGIDPSMVEVIYLANSLDGRYRCVDEPPSLKRFVLFVGTRTKYKNFRTFIKAIGPILREDKDLHVICAGGGGFSVEESQLFRALDISKQIEQQTVDDGALAELYRQSLCFVFPSLYEGFGLPVLESFACGAPLVCSNSSSLPEIAGNGALLFDPHDEHSIYEAVKRVVYDGELQELLRGEGAERLKAFSWEKAAKQTRDLYKSILS